MGLTHEQPTKKRRLENTGPGPQTSFANVNQLEATLRSQSNLSPDVRTSIQRFKDFLSGITRSDNTVKQAKDLQTLHDYCVLQKSPTKEHVDFPDLLATWSQAVEAGHDSIASAIPAVLAQFFKTISGFLQFREFGLSLCHSLLKRDQVRLLDRGLSSARSKEHLISPCLRLMTEIASFDVGAMAIHLFGRRDVLFKRLDHLLEPRPSEGSSDRRRPTLRRMALRLVIANLKYLDSGAKSELLSQPRVLRSVLQGLVQDGDDIVVDTLQVIDTNILEDSEFMRSTKTKIFGADNLSMLASLYDYPLDPEHPDAVSSVREALHKLMLKLCSTRKGIAVSQTGWYPVGYDFSIPPPSDSNHIELGLDSPHYFDDYSSKVPVMNTALSTFLHTLKPDVDTMQMEVLLKTLTHVPELVADYLTKRSSFSVSTAEDSKWRSQFAILFSIVQLPLPKDLGWHRGFPALPPPISVVIENVLPKPLDKTILTRFFSLNDEMLILSGSRLLSVALEKLNEVLRVFAKSQHSASIWAQASHRLVQAVLQRAPLYRDITEAFQRYGRGNPTTRVALFECIATLHRVLPEATAGSQFDFGPVLSDTLTKLLVEDDGEVERKVLKEQLPWLLTVCSISSATNWWSKSGNESLSLFTMLLRFITLGGTESARPETLAVVEDVAMLSGIFGRSAATVLAVLQSLQSAKSFQSSGELFLFIDMAMHRAIQKPVKFLDSIETVQQLISDKTPLSLLACSVADQWTFVLQKHSGQKGIIKNISKWIARYYSALDAAGENFRVMARFQEVMLEAADEKSREYLRSSFEKTAKKPVELTMLRVSGEQDVSNETVPPNSDKATAIMERTVNLAEVFGEEKAYLMSLDGVDRWDSNTDIEHAVQSNRLARLIFCTSSTEAEIYTQTYQLLQTAAHIVNESSYSEKTQLHLLLGEICETIRQHSLTANGKILPFPSFAAELAIRLLSVITDPSHILFSKANKFLLRGPSWDAKKLITYWTDKILFHEPETDEPGARTEELEWFLDWLISGMRSLEDMEFYRRSGVFEKLLSTYCSSTTARSVRKRILHLIWKAIKVDAVDGVEIKNGASVARGGTAADTLITRLGVREWLQVVEITDPDHAGVIRQLRQSLVAASNDELITAWEKRPSSSKERVFVKC